jgi:hypothetical protein
MVAGDNQVDAASQLGMIMNGTGVGKKIGIKESRLALGLLRAKSYIS